MLKSNAEWEALAKSDPLFAIASVKGRRNNWTTEEFFRKGESYMELLQRAISQIPVSATVLDIGCGAGRISRALAKRVAHVIGVDVAPTMVELAKKMCADVVNAEFRVGDGVSLPAQNGGVDAIVSIQVLQHIDLEAIPSIISECRRVVTTGGLVILHIPAPCSKTLMQEWIRLVPIRRVVTRLVVRLLPRVNVSGRGWASNQYHTYPVSTIASYLRNAGFSSVENFMFREGKPLTMVYVAK